MDPARTIAIIPAYNEEAALPGVLAELRTTLPGVDVVVISDGSRDATADVARASGVDVVELPYNLGIGGALQTGFRFARRGGWRRAVQVDADGQHDPGQIPRLLDALDRGADLVIGSRFATGGFKAIASSSWASVSSASRRRRCARATLAPRGHGCRCCRRS